ncbi:MAG: autotransporter outer membrane beta-barrel domain-containing protein, partial [Hyphomicrobiales bacterium]|nr:autotransporter outer membrane beta-barrel domain-containing protein [Hyphomicrobiales bacterium]
RSAVDGKTSVNISGVSIANERKGLSVDGKLGLSYEWDEGYAVHGEVSALRDDDADEVRADLGVRISF